MKHNTTYIASNNSNVKENKICVISVLTCESPHGLIAIPTATKYKTQNAERRTSNDERRTLRFVAKSILIYVQKRLLNFDSKRSKAEGITAKSNVSRYVLLHSNGLRY